MGRAKGSMPLGVLSLGWLVLAAAAAMVAAPLRAQETTPPKTAVQRIDMPDFESFVLLQSPPDLGEGRKAPLLVALHGMGEDAEVFLPFFSKAAAAHGYFLAVPRGDALTPCRCGKCHDMVRTWSARTGRFVLAILDQLAADHPIDPDRVFLTGFSAGAQAALHTSLSHPQRFAGVAPFAGGAVPRLDDAGLFKLRFMPIFGYVGKRDMARGFMAAYFKRLEALSFERADLVEVEELGHALPVDDIDYLFDRFDGVSESRQMGLEDAPQRLSEAKQAMARERWADAIARLVEVARCRGKGAISNEAATLMAKLEDMGEARLKKALKDREEGCAEEARQQFEAVKRDFEGLYCALKAGRELERLSGRK